MARNFEGLGVGIEVDDNQSVDVVEHLGSSFENLWEKMRKAGSIAPKLGQTLSRGLGDVGRRTGQAFGAATMAVGTMIDKATSPELDHAYSSMYADFNKSFSAMTAGMNVGKKELVAARKAIGGVAFGMGEDMTQAAQNWTHFRQQGVELDKVLGSKGLAGTMKDLIRVTSVYGIEGEQLSVVMASLIKGFGFTEGAVGGLADKMVSVGKVFSMGRESIQAWPGIMESLNAELADFGRQLTPEEIEKLTLSIVQLGGGLKDALGIGPQAALELARTAFTTIAGERKNIIDMFRGMGGEFGDMAKSLMETGGDVNKMFALMTEGDPMQFMDTLREMAKEAEQRGGTTGMAFQRLSGVINKALGPDMTFAMQGNWDKVRDKMAQVPGAIEGSEGAFKKVAKEGYKSSITAGEAWDRMMESMKARLFSLSQKEVMQWQKDMKSGFKDTFEAISVAAKDDGPLGELTRRMLAVQRVGLTALVPGLSSLAPLLGGITSAALPTLTAMGSMGLTFGNLGKMAMGGGLLWGVFNLLKVGPEEAWAKITSFGDNFTKLFDKLPKKTQKKIMLIKEQLLGVVETIKSGEIFAHLGKVFDKIPFKKIFDKIGDVLTGVMGGLGRILGEVDWVNVAKNVVEFLGKAFISIGGLVGALLTGGQKSEMEGQMKAGMGDALVAAISGLKDIALGALKGLWASVFDADSIQGALKNLTTIVGGAFTVLFVMSSKFRGKMASLFLGKEGLVSKFGEKVVGGVSKANKKIDLSFKGMIRSVKSGTEGVFRVMRKADRQISKHGFFGAVSKGMSGATKGFGKGLGKIRAGAGALVGAGLFMGLFEAMDQVKIRMKNISDIMSDELIPDFAKTAMAGNQAFKGMGKTIDAVFMGIPSMVGEMLGITGKDIDGFYYDMVGGAEKAFAYINYGFTSVVDTLSIRWETFKNTLSAGWDFIVASVSYAGSVIKSKWTGVTTYLESAFDTFVTAFEKVFMNIRHTIELGIFKTQQTVVDIIDLLPENLKPSSLADFAKGFKRFSKEIGGEKGIEVSQRKEVTALEEKLRKRDLTREQSRVDAQREQMEASVNMTKKALDTAQAQVEGEMRERKADMLRRERLDAELGAIDADTERTKQAAAEAENRKAKQAKVEAEAPEAAAPGRQKGRKQKKGAPSPVERAEAIRKAKDKEMEASLKRQAEALERSIGGIREAVEKQNKNPIDAYIQVNMDGQKVSKGLKKVELRRATGSGM